MVSGFAPLSLTGTVSVLYLIFVVTLKAVRLGFHLEFHWFVPTEFFVPGEFVKIRTQSLHNDSVFFKVTAMDCKSETGNSRIIC
jgi:hypothetical protein